MSILLHDKKRTLFLVKTDKYLSKVLKQKEVTPQFEKCPLAMQELKSGEKGADTRKSPFGLGFVPAEWALTT